MGTGTWSETQKPSIPGMYNRFMWAAENTLAQGTNGIVAMPVKSNWGPVGEAVSVASLTDLKNKFGSNMNLTAYRLGRLILLGQPKELLLYRLADENAKVASIVLKDDDGKDAIKLETLYPTTRAFNISVKPNIVDESMLDITLYEGAEQLYVFKVSGSIDDIVNAINSNEENIWIKASKVEAGTSESGTSEPVAGSATTGQTVVGK